MSGPSTPSRGGIPAQHPPFNILLNMHLKFFIENVFVKLIVFIDESGLPIYCKYFSQGAIAKVVPKHTSYYSVGAKEIQSIKRQTGLTREVKYRRLVSKIGLSGVSSIISMLKNQGYYLFFKRIHIKEPSKARFECIEKLLKEISSQLLCSNVVIIIDECPLKLKEVRKAARQLLRSKYIQVYFKDSRKVSGLQLADIVVGYFSEVYKTPKE